MYLFGNFEINERERIAVSYAVVSCARLFNPDAFLKTVFFIPIFLAYFVINLANSLSESEICSATTVATSFADLIIRAFTASLTIINEPSSKYNLLRGRDAASFDTLIFVFQFK